MFLWLSNVYMYAVMKDVKIRILRRGMRFMEEERVENGRIAKSVCGRMCG